MIANPEVAQVCKSQPSFARLPGSLKEHTLALTWKNFYL